MRDASMVMEGCRDGMKQGLKSSSSAKLSSAMGSIASSAHDSDIMVTDDTSGGGVSLRDSNSGNDATTNMALKSAMPGDPQQAGSSKSFGDGIRSCARLEIGPLPIP